MQGQRVLVSALIMGLALLLTLAAGLALAQGSEPAVETGVQDAVGAGFTYQGRLLLDGTPVEGNLDFHFTLWTAPSDGDLVGEQTASDVEVNDGYFSVPLDFGVTAFTGDARYLGIEVEGASLEPRVALTAAPYAHSLRPGASVESAGTALQLTTSSTSGAALNAIASTSSGNAAAVYGSSSSPAGAGLSGYNNTSGYGVYGRAGGSTGTPYGVYGLASDAGSATSYGVYGKSNSSFGTGVGGEAPMNGIFGRATASNGYGVYGEATSTSGTTYGVYGKASSTNGKGVYGEGQTGVHGYSTDGAGVWGSSADGWGVSGSSTNDYGVRGGSTNSAGVYGTAPTTGTVGIATASSGSTYGVFGKASSLSGRGVYGEGGFYGVYAVGTDPTGIAHGVYGRTKSNATGASGMYGHASAGSGATYGVYGKSDSPEGFGVYSDGKAHVEGNLTVSRDLAVAGDIIRATRTATLSVAPAAFWPQKHDIEYTNEGYYLKPMGALGPLYPFYAPLQLPQNARITRITGCFWTARPLGSEGDLRIGVDRGDFAGGSETLAFAWAPETPGDSFLCFSDDTIQEPVIDSNSYTYYLWMSMRRDAEFYGVKVEYEHLPP